MLISKKRFIILFLVFPSILVVFLTFYLFLDTLARDSIILRDFGDGFFNGTVLLFFVLVFYLIVLALIVRYVVPIKIAKIKFGIVAFILLYFLLVRLLGDVLMECQYNTSNEKYKSLCRYNDQSNQDKSLLEIYLNLNK